MFYAFSYTPVVTDTEANPHKIDLRLSAGVIHQVDVVFQSGCQHNEYVRIFHGNFQVWPSNRGEKLRGDGVVISFRDFYEMNPGDSRLTAHVWTTLFGSFKEVVIQIGVLPKGILQPLSFAELVKAAVGE